MVRFVFFMKNYQGGLNVLFLGVSNIPQWGAGPHLVQNLSKSPIAVGPGEVSCAGGQFIDQHKCCKFLTLSPFLSFGV